MEPTQKKPHRKLSKKEKGFVKDYIETGNGVQSVLNNYDTDNYKSAGVIACENLAKPRIIKAIAERLPDDLLEEKHLALLNKIDKEGGIDVQAVSKGLDMAYKVKGAYKSSDEPPQGNKNIYNFFFNKEVQEEVKNLEDRIKLALIQKRNDKEN